MFLSTHRNQFWEHSPFHWRFEKFTNLQKFSYFFLIKMVIWIRRNQFWEQQFLSEIVLSELRVVLLAPSGAYVFLEISSNFMLELFLTHLLQKIRQCCCTSCFNGLSNAEQVVPLEPPCNFLLVFTLAVDWNSCHHSFPYQLLFSELSPTHVSRDYRTGRSAFIILLLIYLFLLVVLTPCSALPQLSSATVSQLFPCWRCSCHVPFTLGHSSFFYFHSKTMENIPDVFENHSQTLQDVFGK